ncbi:GABA-gated chloride channel 1 [Dirofilaria immitis]|nr:GABA-gated chloride channel 1 [Dirofilaria immitis]
MKIALLKNEANCMGIDEPIAYENFYTMPKHGIEPVNVGITIHVSSVSAVSEVDMDFTIDFYLRQTWNDPRLAFKHYLYDIFENDIDSLTVGVDYLHKLWKPDTFFPNEKKSYFHVTTTHNSFLRIYPNGNVFTSQRLTVTAMCNMELQLFPMDSQKCKLEIESYGYSVLDIIYFFNNSKNSISKSEFELPQFVLDDIQIGSRNIVLTSGNYSRLTCAFLFKRNIGFYIIQVYLPSILIVVISWVSFWLSRDATPARVALNVLTILTMTTLTATTNASMPKVSYIKSIDIFLGVSFVMVFSSLLEFAAVGYISKRIKLIRKRQKDMRNRRLQTSNYFYAMPSTTENTVISLYHPFYSSRDKNSTLYNGGEIKPPGECQCPIPPPSPTPTNHAEENEKRNICYYFRLFMTDRKNPSVKFYSVLHSNRSDKMVNISNELLDKFYDLADFDQCKRHNAVIAILDNFEQNASYFMERLISGLASSRAAARLGYTNALTIILSSFGKDWPVEVLFKMADQNLPLNKTENSGSILGQHLFHLAMAICEIAKREMSLVEKQNSLAYSATNLLAQCANKLRGKKFTKEFWPLPLDSLVPEWFYFALCIMEKHSNTFKGEVSFLSASGELYISDNDYDKVVNILKKASGFAENELILKLLLRARISRNFETIYSKVVEKWLYHGDLHRVISRAIPFINAILQQADFETDELVAVFSPEFIRLIRSVRRSSEFRFLFPTIEAILLVLKESLTTKEWNSTNTAKLLDSFDRAIEEGGWRLRRITNVFLHWPANVQERILKLLFKHGKWTEDIRNAFCSCIASLFVVSVRAGRNVTAIYNDEHKKLLQKLSRKQDAGIKSPVTNGTLSTFMNVLTLWIAAASNSNERQSYLSDLAEIATISEKMTENDNTSSVAVLNDLLLSLLSRPHRYHRSIVHYVFASFVSQMKLENLLQIFETINLSNEELMQEKDASESDDEDGKDEDSSGNSEHASEENEINNNGNIMDQQEETDESDFEEEDEEKSEVDEEFVNNLKSALGSAAARSDNDDEDSLSSTVSDETMFRLDEGLAAVFRKRMKNSRSLSAFLVEQAQQFRAKCFDLLLIAISHQEGAYKTVDLILPLIECAQQALHRKDGELTFKKATSLLEIIIKHKKNELDERHAIKLMDELVLATSRIVNPVMRNILGSFSSCYDANENAITENMHIKVVELLEKYMNDNKNQILNEIVLTPFIKYPHALSSELPRIIDFAFDENVRTFQRVEALSCAVAFLRKDLVSIIYV